MRGFATTAIMLVLLGLVATALAVPTDSFKKVHLQMMEQELKHVFPGLTPATIPEYEVVSLKWPRLHRRSVNSGTKIRLNAFGKDIHLWLHPTEGTLVAYDTPVYLARYSSSTRTGVRFSKIRDPMTVVGKMLEDREKLATFIVKRSVDGRNYISGNVASEDWIVRPLPDRFNEQAYFSRYKKSNELPNNATIDEYDESHPHVIYKNPKLSDEARYINKPIEHDIPRNKASRSKRAAAPSIIYPQILVITDHETYKRHGEDVYGMLEYLLPFWNGVDLRYRGLEFPKVRLNIAGIVIAADSNALSYMKKNKVGSETLNIFGALSDFGKFMPTVKSSFPFTNYDVAITMSPFEMCSLQDSGICQTGTLGLAYLSGACDIRKDSTPITLSVAMIQDKGAFDGMHTAAHELGHLLGAPHDGQGESLCAGDAGHIMASTPVLTENSSDWSRCTLLAFDKFFNSDEPACLFDKPKTSYPLDRVLPGRLMTMDEQCEKLEGTKWCHIADNPCMRLKCIYSKDSNYCIDVGDAAADGSKCGNGKICIHGKCLADADIA